MRKDGGGGGRYQSRAPPPSNSHYDYPAGRESMYPRQMYSMGGRMAGGTFHCRTVYRGTQIATRTSVQITGVSSTKAYIEAF